MLCVVWRLFLVASVTGGAEDSRSEQHDVWSASDEASRGRELAWRVATVVDAVGVQKLALLQELV